MYGRVINVINIEQIGRSRLIKFELFGDVLKKKKRRQLLFFFCFELAELSGFARV